MSKSENDDLELRLRKLQYGENTVKPSLEEGRKSQLSNRVSGNTSTDNFQLPHQTPIDQVENLIAQCTDYVRIAQSNSVSCNSKEQSLIERLDKLKNVPLVNHHPTDANVGSASTKKSIKKNDLAIPSDRFTILDEDDDELLEHIVQEAINFDDLESSN